MIERQVIATWYTPAEKLPPAREICVATVSGQNGFSKWDHAFALVTYDPATGWNVIDYDMTCFEVIAWCDLDVYRGASAFDRINYEV